jgi:hypothetical protein
MRPEAPKKIIKDLGTAATLAEIRNFNVPNKNRVLYAKPLIVIGIVLLIL